MPEGSRPKAAVPHHSLLRACEIDQAWIRAQGIKEAVAQAVKRSRPRHWVIPQEAAEQVNRFGTVAIANVSFVRSPGKSVFEGEWSAD